MTTLPQYGIIHSFNRMTWLLVMLLAVACTRPMATEDIDTIAKGGTFDRVGDYKIGPGDALTVKVYGEESLSGDYVVAPSGMLQLPLIGFTQAQGLTQVQLAQKVEQQLRSFVREARVAISVTDALSFEVYFSGEVATRGARILKGRTTLLQGVILAGGLTDFAAGQIYLIRRVGDHDVKRYVTSYKDLLRGRKGLDFYYLERGDIIHAE